MPAPANLVRESSNSTGTGSFTTAAVNGYVRFSDSTYAFGTGGTNVFWYFISNRSAAEWEIGTGHMSDANTLVRDTVLFSSNANSAVNFTAGTKDVCNDIPANYQVFVEGTPAQGDIIYRGASAWERLAAGTDGQFLQTQGAGADPQWASAGGLTLLNSGSVSSASTLDIVLTSYTAYRGFKVILGGFRPATDDVTLYLRFSSNGGSTFDAGASNYKFIGVSQHVGGQDTNSSSGATQINLTRDAGSNRVGNATNEGVNLEVELYNLTSAAFYSRCNWRGAQMEAGGTDRYIHGCAFRLAAQDTDAIRFLFSSGNIAEGNWALYGYS